MVNILNTVIRPLQAFTRFIQWSSAVIAMSFTAWLINRAPEPRNVHIIYEQCIGVISVVFFLPGFLSIIWPKTFSWMVLGIDIIFSYLWITAFIFAASDWSRKDCYSTSPPGVGCSLKHANEAFFFIGFWFTFMGMFLEASALWCAYNEYSSGVGTREKIGGHTRNRPMHDGTMRGEHTYTPGPTHNDGDV